LELDNQDLKEIIEVASQINAQLEVENIIRNVVLSFYAKFKMGSVTFLLPNEMDEEQVTVYHYLGLKRAETGLKLPALNPLISFFEKDEYNQISFASFQEAYPNPGLSTELQSLAPDILIPLRTDKGVTGLVLLPRREDGQEYKLLDIQYITQIIRFAAIAIENANLYWQATTDRMTKLFSHHFFLKSLEDEISRARRYGTVFSLIMFDIDHFKRFNDTYGHLQGDIIIKEIARILRGSVRSIDLSARYGGEEFAVILPGVDGEGATVVAERIRERVEKQLFPGEEGPLRVTISIGVAEFIPKRMSSPSQIIAEADKALYHSKESGRNRVTVAKK